MIGSLTNLPRVAVSPEPQKIESVEVGVLSVAMLPPPQIVEPLLLGLGEVEGAICPGAHISAESARWSCLRHGSI